ncbi:hypothetical protein [Gracilibacillus dipsosauri]|uniref:Uncharacterized protein n=1 Tax=Gracilibacillus dipsosauri TaxID=178340 RepID=A0A317KVG8_9BACI|nr:hypothetical protein [Gracilibacillus dipsosauri]PWU67293.1 hypothetical protein DLJ74_17155 [Gracilibacillus dipsosauri]
MKNLLTYINSLIAAIITTLFILTASFLIMLFSSGEEGYRTTYFGSLFFNSTPTSEDTLEMQFGVANGIPIFITIAILFVLFIFILSLFKRKSAAS